MAEVDDVCECGKDHDECDRSSESTSLSSQDVMFCVAPDGRTDHSLP